MAVMVVLPAARPNVGNTVFPAVTELGLVLARIFANTELNLVNIEI
jgi:hypothetical protein